MNKFFYLYLICGIIMVLLLIYQVATLPTGKNEYVSIGFKVLAVVWFFYMSIKVYREKIDKDLM